MRIFYLLLLVVALSNSSAAQQNSVKTYEFLNTGKPQPQKLFTAPNAPNLLEKTAPVIPSNIGNQFNEGIFTAKEQVHDTQIAELLTRVSNLEGTSNWAKGVFYGFLVFGGLVIGFLGRFWKGMLLTVINEACPRILRP